MISVQFHYSFAYNPVPSFFICLSIHIHMKERIMDDFDPTNPATLSGHLKALELLGQLTARAGPARRYVRAHVALLSVSLSVSLSLTNSPADMHTRTCAYAHLHTLTHTLTLTLSFLPSHIHTHAHKHTPPVPLPQLTTKSPPYPFPPINKTDLTSISGRL